MGNAVSQITEEELLNYKDLTYLTGNEILHIFKIFKNINPSQIAKNKNVRIPIGDIKKHIPEFKHNPFSNRLCQIFSSNNDGKLSFEDFLDMMSILSTEAPLKKKAEYAFMVYDFDNDGYISREDLQELISLLTGNEKLDETELNKLIDCILSEADFDNDGCLSFNEFQHVVEKSSADFMRY